MSDWLQLMDETRRRFGDAAVDLMSRRVLGYPADWTTSFTEAATLQRNLETRKDTA